MVKTTVTKEEWNDRNDIESTIVSRAYVVAGIDWTGYTTFIDEIDGVNYIMFVKNNLVEVNSDDGVIARWENDDTMVVRVEVVINA